MQAVYKYLYVRKQADEDNDDGSDDSFYIPVNKITGMMPISTTRIQIFFESALNMAGNGTDDENVISDSVVINVIAGKTKQVLQTIVRTINENRFSDGVIVLADDVTTTFADATVSAKRLDDGIDTPDGVNSINIASALT